MLCLLGHKRLLLQLVTQGELLMATMQDFQDQLLGLKTATADIAADLQALKDQLVNAGLDKATEDSVLAELSQAVAALKAVGDGQ